MGGWVSAEQSVLSLKTEIEISYKDVGKNNTGTPRGTTMLSGIKISEIAMLTLTIACNKQLAKKFKWPFKSSNWHIEELIIRYCDILWIASKVNIFTLFVLISAFWNDTVREVALQKSRCWQIFDQKS